MNKLYEDLYLQAEKEGYKTAEKMCKEIYKTQKQDREELLNKIARALLNNEIEDNKLKIDSIVRKTLTKEFNNFIRDIAKKQYENEKLITEDILSLVTKDKYNKNSYITNLGIDYTIQKLTDSQIHKIVHEKIEGEVWSNRIWENKKQLEKQLKKEVGNFLKGNTNVNKIEKNIKTKFNQNAYKTHRLVETEVCRCQNYVNDVFAEEHNIEKQMYCATLDERTCPKCANDDGEIFDINDTNKPNLPRHPLDRCCYINIPSDNWKPKVRKDNITKEYVPFITYDEWYEYKIINDPTFIVKEKKYKNKYSDKKQYLKYKEVLGKEIPKSFDKFQELKYNNIKEWGSIKNKFEPEFIKKDFKDIPSFHKNSSDLLTRKWYKWHDENIPKLIDKTNLIEEQAKQAHNLRNTYRTQARDLMKDQEERRMLDIEHPNIAFDILVESKMKRKNMNREEAIKDILKSATKTNKKVNKLLGLE